MSSRTNSENAADAASRRDDIRWAAAGGVAAAFVGFAAMAIVGSATKFEARRLLEAVLPTVRFAASSYIAGGATILALMLTLITFSITHELDFTPSHYKRIRGIAAMTTAVIVGSVILLMFLSFPVGDTDVDRQYHLWVYYGVLVGSAVTGGVFISTVLMLFYAVRGLIGVAEDASASELVITPDPDDS
ncbi:MAG: hypothetical protein KDB21_19095 [Acidimicrobiales bacterium]|nr:hypothetical protein [Acidimicrobiales bacterium]